MSLHIRQVRSYLSVTYNMFCKVPCFYIAGFIFFTVLAEGYELKTQTFETVTYKH